MVKLNPIKEPQPQPEWLEDRHQALPRPHALYPHHLLPRSQHQVIDVCKRKGPAVSFVIDNLHRGWAAAGVNHKLIFELDPRNFSSHFHLLETAAWLAVIWSASIVAFIFADLLSIPAFYSPLAMMITFALFLFNPFKVLKYEARRWLLKITLRILLAPIPLVVFADFWVSPPPSPPSLPPLER